MCDVIDDYLVSERCEAKIYIPEIHISYLPANWDGPLPFFPARTFTYTPIKDGSAKGKNDDFSEDALLERDPFVESALGTLNCIESKEVTGYLAGTTVATIFYLTQRSTTEKKARKIIENLLALFQVASVGQETLISYSSDTYIF